MEVFTSPVAIVTIIGAMIAAFTDITRFKVYNTLTIPLCLSGLLYHTVTAGVGGLGLSFLGMMIGFALLVIPFLMGGMGGGDVKLLAGIGAWVGVPAILFVFIAAGLMSGLCAIAMLLWQRRSLSALVIDVLVMWNRLTNLGQQVATESWVENRIAPSEPRRRVIPFGVMVALAVIITFACAASLGAI